MESNLFWKYSLICLILTSITILIFPESTNGDTSLEGQILSLNKKDIKKRLLSQNTDTLPVIGEKTAASDSSSSEETDNTADIIVTSAGNMPVEDLSGDIPDKSQLSLAQNSYVEHQIKYLTETKRDFLVKAAARGEFFITEMKEIFKREGLPEELAYLPLIESGFNNYAVSYMGATGMWQFMPGTAKWLGMKMNSWLDDRYDPIRACEYAAEFLSFLYDKLGCWELALAAYNHGGFNVKKAIKRAGSRDFYDLIKKGGLPRETREYVPRFIASVLILQNPEKYNLSYTEKESSYTYISLSFMSPAHLVAKYADMTTSEFMKLNSGLRSGYVPHPSYKYKVRLPRENHDILLGNLEKLKKVSYDNYTIYYIRSGDNLSTIAQKFGISMYIIMSLNKISNANKIWEGQKLYIPVVRPVSKQTVSSTGNSSSSYYIVKAGETLSHIAYKLGVSADTIIKLNNIANPGFIREGEKLRIP